MNPSFITPAQIPSQILEFHIQLPIIEYIQNDTLDLFPWNLFERAKNLK